MIRQVVVIAGGLATRLHPITMTIPKAMVEVAGKPFLYHLLKLFKENGIEQVVMCVGHLAEQIMDYAGDGTKFGLSVVYSIEDRRLDTGGALKLALPHLDDVFFVTYGDGYLLQPYPPLAAFFEAHSAEGVMCVYENNNQIEPSRVLLDGEYVKQYKKEPPPIGANYMEYGINILKKSTIERVQKEVFPISDYFDLLTDKRQLLAYHVADRFYEIGSKQGLAETESLIYSRQ